MGCKSSILNVKGTEKCHSNSIVELGDSPFPIISPLGNKNWPSSMKVNELEKFQ